MYYNTNKESGNTLANSTIKAKTQEQIIFNIFTENTNLTASEAWKIYNQKGNTPLTSIRRAITNLCNKGKLIKTKDTKPGLYGKKEHVYTLVVTEAKRA
jgi:predicted transcriptional regulator